jgi:hypothetical protein
MRSGSVSWTAGRVDWGTGGNRAYQVTVYGPNDANISGSCTTPVPATATSCAFVTDANGIYTVLVAAVTDAGESAQYDLTSLAITTAPAAPTEVGGTAGANSITVTWRPPAVTGAGITGYTVTATAPYYPIRSCAVPVTRSPCTITGLAAGVRYVPRVVAVGKGGSSALASGTTTVLPSGAVQAPQSVPSYAVATGSRAAGPGTRLALSGSGFRRATEVLLNLYPGGRSLGTVTTSSGGALSASVTMPADVTNGPYTVLATGLDRAGRARYLATSVRVAGAAAIRTLGGAGSGARTSTTTAPSMFDLAVTGPAAGPVLLGGFLLIMTGLLLRLMTAAPSDRPRHQRASRAR